MRGFLQDHCFSYDRNYSFLLPLSNAPVSLLLFPTCIPHHSLPTPPILLRLPSPRAAGLVGCLLRAEEGNEVLQCHLPDCNLEWLHPIVYFFPSHSIFHGFSTLVLLRTLFPSQSRRLGIYQIQWDCTLGVQYNKWSTSNRTKISLQLTGFLSLRKNTLKERLGKIQASALQAVGQCSKNSKSASDKCITNVSPPNYKSLPWGYQLTCSSAKLQLPPQAYLQALSTSSGREIKRNCSSLEKDNKIKIFILNFLNC